MVHLQLNVFQSCAGSSCWQNPCTWVQRTRECASCMPSVKTLLTPALAPAQVNNSDCLLARTTNQKWLCDVASNQGHWEPFTLASHHLSFFGKCICSASALTDMKPGEFWIWLVRFCTWINLVTSLMACTVNTFSHRESVYSFMLISLYILTPSGYVFT